MLVLTIYGLLHPRTKRLRYVGCTTDPHTRWLSHCNGTSTWSSTKLFQWLKSLGKDKPIMVTLGLAQRDDDGAFLEHFYIVSCRKLGLRLVNADNRGYRNVARTSRWVGGKFQKRKRRRTYISPREEMILT